MAEISLELASNIIYVAGYVNNVLTIFNQDDLTGKWRANVDASNDGLYYVSLQMYDEAGNVGYFEKVIEYILPLFVYDRTLNDVEKAINLKKLGWSNMTEVQKSEWIKGLKGCINTSDLKRIENDIYVIAQLVNVNLQTNKDNIPKIPNHLYFQTLLNNVSMLRNTGYFYNNTPTVPEQPINTYQKVNDIEHILHDVYEIYVKNNSSFPYCGTEIYSGQEIGLI